MARWFGPKRIGYGATPRSWQGWGLTLVAFPLALLGCLRIPYAAYGIDPRDGRMIATVAVIGFYLLVVWLTYGPDPEA